MPKELKNALWAIFNEVRKNSSLKLEQAQPYFLGFMFFKFLSEKIETEVNSYKGLTKKFHQISEDDEYYEDVKGACIDNLGYFVDYKYTFNSIISQLEEGTDVSIKNVLAKAFKEIEDSTIGSSSAKDFSNLFSNIILDNPSLGGDDFEKSKTLFDLLKSFDREEFKMSDMSTDKLGDTYEFIISKFAGESGQKAGEFYTPKAVSELVAKIATIDKKEVGIIYDPTCGSGSLLIKAKKEVGDNFQILLGQEKITETFNLTRMNMFLHGIKYQDFKIANGNTLTNNKFIEKENKVDVIVANPPFSVGWDPEGWDTDDRFRHYPKAAPKSKADYAFIQHMIHMLKPGGQCAVVVPHGVLFRGAAEGAIRKYLVGTKKYLRAVVGLPTNMFFNASIPACILFFKKETSDEDILFIEGSKEFVKMKNKNEMTEENVSKIFDVFKNKKEVEKFSRLVSLKEIEENDYNLNITRYIDTFEEEEEIDIKAVNSELLKVNKEIEDLEEEIQKMISELRETK